PAASLRTAPTYPQSDLLKVQRSEVLDQEKECDQESEIANAIDDKCLLTGRSCRILGEPESDQQVRSKSHALPAYKHQQIIAGQHQREHKKHEQVQIGEETIETALLPHVTD